MVSLIASAMWAGSSVHIIVHVKNSLPEKDIHTTRLFIMHYILAIESFVLLLPLTRTAENIIGEWHSTVEITD